jgi:hypothetical protein
MANTPPRRRSTILGFCYFGAVEGSGVLAPLVGYLIDRFRLFNSVRHERNCHACRGDRLHDPACTAAELARRICQLMKLHVGIVAQRLPDIARAMQEDGMSAQDVYDRSAYAARYTDVVP